MSKLIIISLACLLINTSLLAQSNKYVRQAKKLEESGMVTEAADYYIKAIYEKNTNIDAIIGAKRTTPKVLNAYLSKFNDYYKKGKYEEAIKYYYNGVLAYQEKLKRINIDLVIPDESSNSYDECKRITAEKYYQDGKRAMELGNMENAVSSFKRCQEFISDYKDASEFILKSNSQIMYATAEKHYQAGVNNLSSGNFRTAYSNFDKCLELVSDYKDAWSLRAEALKNAKVRVGVFEFKNDTRVYGANNILYSYVITNLIGYRSPFIDIVDRDNLERLLNEQRMGASGIVDQTTAARMGKILGLDYVIIGRLINVEQRGGNVTSTPVTAYELYSYQSHDGRNIFRGRPVTFNLYEGSGNTTFEASCQLISAETGQIINSEIFTATDSDYIKYATYNGDSRLLCGMNPDETTFSQILATQVMINQELFNSRQNLKTSDEMQTNILKELSDKMAASIYKQF